MADKRDYISKGAASILAQAGRSQATPGGKINSTPSSSGQTSAPIGNSYVDKGTRDILLAAGRITPQTEASRRAAEQARLNTAADAAKKAYEDYLKSSANRQYQKTWGRQSEEARRLYQEYNTAMQERDAYANQSKLQNFADIASGLRNNTAIQSEADKQRAVNLGASKPGDTLGEKGLPFLRNATTEAQRQQKMGYSTWDTEKYQAMNDKEVETYNRLIKNGHEKEAQEFLDALDSTLNYRVTKARTDKAREAAQDGFIGGAAASAGSTLLNLLGTGVQAELAAIRAWRNDEAIDPYAEEMYGRNLSSTLRGTVSEEIGNWAATLPVPDQSLAAQSGKFAAMPVERQQESNRKIAEFLYNTGMSMVDMVAVSPMGSTGMSIIMGTNAAADTLIDAKNRGLTDEQAMAMSIISGAAEVVAEKYSLDRLFDGKVSTSTLKAALTQGGVEASEEMVTELANTLADVFVLGNQSAFEAAISAYQEQGMTYQQAENKAFVDVLADIAAAGAGGFLSGFGMGAAADVMNTQSAGRSVIDRAAETYIRQGQTPEQARQSAIDYLKGELRAVGALADEGSVAYKLSQKTGDMSNADIGRAHLANMEQMANIISSGKATVTPEQLAQEKPATAQESMSMDASDPRNVRRYQNEITAALNGAMDSDQMVMLGKPSEILSQYMDSNSPLMIAQNVIKKVSAVEGKHQLSRAVLDELPYQFKDPVAITGNTSKHVQNGDNSIIVWTDWQVDGQDPVIVPIRIDAEGNIGLYNNVNSVFPLYDADYMSDILREGNVLYTRNNENIRDLLAQGREVPKRKIEDVFNNSISKSSESVNIPEQIATLQKRYDELPYQYSREGIDIHNRISELMGRQDTVASVADDKTMAQQQLDISEKEQNFAKNLSQAAQNLNLVNAETKALGREYYTHSEEMPSLQDIQKKNIEDFTSEDFSVLAKNLLGSGKQRLYTKETSRVFDTVAGNNKALRNTLYNLFEKPFNEAGGNYGKSLTSSVESYKEIMRKYDIKPKSKEDIAAQRYGEGQYQGPDGEMIEYTLADLQRDCPDTWENVKGFAEANRRVYEDYLNRINSIMETIYPNILENAEEEYQTAVSRRDVAQSKVDAMTRAITEKQNRIQRLQDTRNNKQRTDTKAFAKIEGSIAAEQAKVDSMKTELVQLEKKLRVAEMNAQAQRAAIDSGAIYEGKRIIPRKDYFHHAQEMLSDYSVLDFLRPKNVTEDVSPALAGVSDQTKPKSRWWGAMFHRGQGAYFESASNAMASYIGMAEYKLAYDPLTNYYRKLETTIRASADTINAKNASGFIEWFKDWTDGMSGKSDHVIDRGVQKILSRQTLNSLNNLNKRVRANKVLGNIRSMIVQASNLPNAMSYVTSPKAWAQGIQMLADYHHNPDSKIAKARGQSQFMAQRYGSNAMEILESDGLSAKKLAGKGMELLQHWGDELTWFSAFAQYNENPQAAMSGMKRTYDNAIDYADDITRRSVAGRGVGEGALVNNSKVVNLVAPFQTEILNQWNTFFEHVKDLKAGPQARARAAAGLAMYEVGAFVFNAITQAVLGDKVLGLSFIDALVDTITNAINDDDEDEEKDALDYAKELGQASLGTVVDAAPFINIITSFMGDETSKNLFGEHSPTRYGTGNIGIRAAADAMMWGKDTVETLIDMVGGKATAKDLDWEGGLDAVGNFVTPWGGTQLGRSVKGLVTYAQGGKYDKEGNLQYAVAQTPINFLRAATLGRKTLPEQKEWAAKGFPTLSPEQTKAYGEFKKAGGSIIAFTDFKSKYDELKKTIGEDNTEINTLAKEIETANPLLSEAEAKERAQNQLGKKYRNAENEYLALIANSDMTDDQKLAAMTATGMSDDDIQKVKGLLNNGISVGEYLKYQNFYSSRGSTKTEDKNALVSALMADKTLSEKDKTMLANKLIDGDWEVDFSSQAANDILTKHGRKAYHAYKQANAEGGITAETYLDYADKKEKIISDYDQYGNSIDYSKKAKVVNFLDSLDISEEQREYMYHEFFEYTSSYASRYKKLKQIDGVWYYKHNGEWIRPTY